ncbi:hypothetical protein HF086_000978 [Spodoptera exigua]|uniref:Retrotransposon gag domain-containing protein n=1 Tax=Spodoptera exigua TaxID=7107 RepID=A0A922MKZ7_SPOEX|nr:hypothetical protein HF086_000978 [Spodoptera exigua]
MEQHMKEIAQYMEIFSQINDLRCQAIISDQVKLGKSDKDTEKNINELSKEFLKLYEEVKKLCEVVEMETFSLKTALGLLPLMTDDETVTQQLIDNIEYYGSTLSEAACKVKLINFVLKSRLSQAGKLKLNESYSTIGELIQDMKCKLLAQKSANSIQTKLQQLRQNDKTINDYGQELSQLFVDLTISQSKGDANSYKVLKPLNEKMAIKRFADGLRNRRLSTIIASRNFDSLKDAVQAALDEEITTATTDIIGHRDIPNNTITATGKHSIEEVWLQEELVSRKETIQVGTTITKGDSTEDHKNMVFTC